MSNLEQSNNSGQATPKPRRWPVVAAGTALVLLGGVVGIIITGPSFGQGWQHSGYGNDARWSDGPHGPMGGPMMHGGGSGPMAAMHGGPTWDGPMPPQPHLMHAAFGGLGPIDWHVDFVLERIGASAEQRAKIKPIIQRTGDQLFELRSKHLEGRKQIRDTLAAPTIDRAKLESLRTEQLKLADQASKVITDALADAAEVLTPEQRAELARHIEARQRWFRG